MYIGTRGNVTVGMQLTFYNLETLAMDGIANITAIGSKDANLTTAFQQGLQKLQLLDWSIEPVLVTLSNPVNLTGTYDLVDIKEVRVQGFASAMPNVFQCL